MFFAVFMISDTNVITYYESFHNAYQEWVRKSSLNPVIREILSSGEETAFHDLVENKNEICMEFGDWALGVLYFEDGREINDQLK